MSYLKLSKRLEAIAKLIPCSGGVADIGTDHGYIPVWLRQNGFSDKILATDIGEGPLEHAIETAVTYNLADDISFLLCDGLKGVCGKYIKTIVIAGMGGETISEILSAAPWTLENNRLLILQPMTKSSHLRSWLFENGYKVLSESLIEDDRVYEIITAAAGVDIPYSEAELLTGHTILIKNDPLYSRRLDDLIAKAERAARGLSSSSKPDDKTRLIQNEDILKQLRTLKDLI